MAVSPNDLILAAQFNTLRNRTASLLGNGVSDFGYGQPVQSSEISAGAVITAARLATLKSDMSRIYLHQTGNPFPLDTISTGDIVGADSSGSNATKGYNDYLSLLTTLENNRFDIASSQQDVDMTLAGDARTLSWSYTTITSEFLARFATTNDRRHFFNSGGEVRISGDVINLDLGSPSYDRNLGWQNMITNPGQIKMGHNYIDASNPGVTNVVYAQGKSFGNYQITSTFREVFRKNASTSVYENSYWTIEVRNDNPTEIRFRIRFVDAGPESNVDPNFVKEPVTADIFMNYGNRRALGDPSGSSVTHPGANITVVNFLQ